MPSKRNSERHHEVGGHIHLNLHHGCTNRLALFLCTFIVSCSDKQRVSDLQKQTDELQAQVRILKDSVDRLEQRQYLDQTNRFVKKVDYLRESGDYSFVESDTHNVTIRLQSIEPIGNGTQLTFGIDTPSISPLNGATATLEWGRVNENGKPMKNKVHSRQVSLAPIWVGSLSPFRGYLDGVRREEVGFVQVRKINLQFASQ